MVNVKTQSDQMQRNECKRLGFGGLVAVILQGTRMTFLLSILVRMHRERHLVTYDSLDCMNTAEVCNTIVDK
jgi:hypothetical protein